jgi:hypothetical protein
MEDTGQYECTGYPEPDVEAQVIPALKEAVDRPSPFTIRDLEVEIADRDRTIAEMERRIADLEALAIQMGKALLNVEGEDQDGTRTA